MRSVRVEFQPMTSFMLSSVDAPTTLAWSTKGKTVQWDQRLASVAFLPRV